jgi:hypothetical protein
MHGVVLRCGVTSIDLRLALTWDSEVGFVQIRQKGSKALHRAVAIHYMSL